MRPAAVVADKPLSADGSAAAAQHRPLKVIIAGAGIGGLVLAVALIKKGIDVAVFERDLTAIRGEGKYRGPIQVSRKGRGSSRRRGVFVGASGYLRVACC